ncbi:MAG TPA: hypothetical protein PKI03_33240 [Pseudomonadota bacterium]|nr:hypothetical protein [Pseudomonadota bacterium]
MRRWALLAYGLGIAALSAGILLRAERPRTAVHSLERARQRGEIAPDLPRLDANDAMANAALLNAILSDVPHPGFARDHQRCEARARSFAVQLRGRLSRVRFGARSVCQLRRLKAISAAQPGFGPRGLAEVAAFVLGRRLQGPVTQDAIVDVDVSRIVVPPFRFGDATLTFTAADLGPLQPGELFIGTYHTHPEGDVSQGVLSETDIDYMRQAVIEFGGELAGEALAPTGTDLSANHAAEPPPSSGSSPSAAGSSESPPRLAPLAIPRSDWLFDIVDPREGDWNVYAHDGARLSELSALCRSRTPCPLNELRIAGSRFHLLARVYEEQDDDAP